MSVTKLNYRMDVTRDEWIYIISMEILIGDDLEPVISWNYIRLEDES